MGKDLIYEVKGLLPEKVVVSIKDELHITEDIDEEVDKSARIFGYYAVLAEKADTRYQKMKFAFEVWEAETQFKINEEREYEEKRSYSEAKMKAAIRALPKYKAFQQRLIQLSEHRRVLKVLARAFEKKAEMVQTKSSNRRSEK